MKKLHLLISLLFSLFSFAQSNTETTITKIIIVRHAEKADDGTKNPPLSAEGMLRAERLSTMLADLKIDKLYATPFLRTNQTLTPLSKKFTIPIDNYEASDVAFAEQLLQKEKGKTIVIAGHSNSSPTLVNRLIKKELYQKLDESVFSKIWILTFKGDELIDCSLLNY
ncbi:phosphoglycerate mutase family protein [Flavobacterium sp.]|uniref:SixA phosphatase family protein n=1 Tax=Flavobacterium sp. TaxID=239 RepID=UPI002B4B10F7|nr:phosphoglycerate mutase family protein [Flavobacterium sp.]HLP64053.1 phosphoglycerate mutase family protein [Flavobacterium sp.]